MLGDTTRVTLAAGTSPMAVGGNTVYYTKSFKIKQGMYFGVWYKATSAAGSPDLKIELEESAYAPATEGAADTNFVLPTGVSALETSLTTETAVCKALVPVPMTYGRFRITGAAGNNADTLLTMELFTQDLLA